MKTRNTVIERTANYLVVSDAKGNTFKISPQDEWVLAYPWRVEKHSKANFTRVAATVRHEQLDRPKTILLHRMIMETPKGLFVDHKNHDETDNTRENLRNVTQMQNLQNRKSKTGTSKYKGVSWSNRTNRWYSAIGANKKLYFLGGFDNEEDAAKAYNEMAVKLHGEFAYLNEII